MPLIDLLSKHTAHLPEALQKPALDFCAQLDEKLTEEHLVSFENEAFAASVLKVCLCSRFISNNWLRRPEIVSDLLNSGDLLSATRRSDYPTVLQSMLIDSEASLAKHLREFRRREMLRIAWRDLAGWADLDETLSDLTALAETCIQTALEFLYRQACERWGIPRLTDGTPFNLVVLGMGKLGAWELNFSSDIDLIFAYAEEGVLTEKKEISYEEFFNRIGRSLIKALDEITADGFVFRTDLRLRPYGDSGPLLMTFDGMEHYYQAMAREWERYAMIKARQVAGDPHTGQQLAAMIKPFVYRHYLDYGAFDALRGIKLQIMQELKRKDRLENIKLGPGGIREVEFIGQAFQLIRGGKDIALQQREIQTVLDALAELELIPATDVAILKFAYRFLRRLENHIQEYLDQQCHDLPADPLRQAILAFSMDFSDWASLKQELDSLRHKVHRIFEDVFSLHAQDSKLQNALLLWVSGSGDEQALETLAEYGCADPGAILEIIVNFKQSHAMRHLSNQGQLVVQQLIPLLIGGLTGLKDQNGALQRILKLFEQVAGRTVYLSLLVENPMALAQLIKLCSASLWICEHLAQFPILFDELIFVRSLYEPLQKPALSQELLRELGKNDILESEQWMITFRKFKNLNMLRVAAADICGDIPLMVVSDHLTWIAEAITEQALNMAWLELGVKHGYPPGCGKTPQNFALIGFGKFGGRELGYASDLDLVFLFSFPDANAETEGAKPIGAHLFYLRLARKFCQILNTKMLSGIAYEVDLRLRPNGDSGLLLTHIDHYEDYLKNEAWTWEHQALIRGRFIAGDARLQKSYETIRTHILSLPRDYQHLKTQVKEMREKMRENLLSKQTDIFDLKQSPGGIADIEFLVQFGVLAETAKHPELALHTSMIALLEELEKLGFFNQADADLLKQAYCGYRDFGHHQILQGRNAVADRLTFAELSIQVQRLWHKFMS
ncbi:MAG: bifunctional [glutamate--ammonia ligase]-adenylyl-L-tyrosine phosphorylase/[glutamate--ammonia-ligase] adenylyltransferase [Methylomonas sp.]